MSVLIEKVAINNYKVSCEKGNDLGFSDELILCQMQNLGVGLL